MDVYLIIMEGKFSSVDARDSSCHGYFIIKFSSNPYAFQEDLHITFKQTLLFMVSLFLLVKRYVKENIYFRSISILVIMFYI